MVFEDTGVRVEDIIYWSFLLATRTASVLSLGLRSPKKEPRRVFAEQCRHVCDPRRSARVAQPMGCRTSIERTLYASNATRAHRIEEL